MLLRFKRRVAGVWAWDAAPDAAGSSGVGGGGGGPPPPPPSSPLTSPSRGSSPPVHRPSTAEEETESERDQWNLDLCLHQYWSDTYDKFRCQVPWQEQQRMLSSTHVDRAIFQLQEDCFENLMLCGGWSRHHDLLKINLYAGNELIDIIAKSRVNTISLAGMGLGRRRAIALALQQCVKSAASELLSWIRVIKLFALKLWYCWTSPAIKRFLPVPRRLSWLMQTAMDSCALVACTVCTEAQHRLEFARLHGAWSFVFKAACPRKLRNCCQFYKFWNRKKGAYIELVLIMIQKKGGVQTTNSRPGPLLLPLSSFRCYDLYHSYDPENKLAAARLIYLHGPCIGVFFIDSKYHSYGRSRSRYCYDDDLDHVSYGGVSRDPLFRRDLTKKDEDAGNHAVVCYAYRFVEDELQLRILDNHTINGPRRWIKYKAFHQLITLRVDPLDRGLIYCSSR
uniref:Uncharacterized protein n=1 Tax=Leersia perrieri TaxID=77586 RepID=A0A0D9VIB2_9ORYZ